VSYTPPAGNAADLNLSAGTGYTAPAGNAADLDLSAGSRADFSFLGAPTLSVPSGIADFTFEPGGALPVTGTLAATLTIDGAVAASFTLPTFTGALGATLAIDGAINATHARVGTLAAVLSIDGAVAGLHPRYRLHGELRDGGALVTSPRRVRAHKRSNGAVVGEVDTSTGVFDIPVGYTLDEFYVVPIDMSSDAVDWIPPVANRVLSVLVSD